MLGQTLSDRILAALDPNLTEFEPNLKANRTNVRFAYTLCVLWCGRTHQYHPQPTASIVARNDAPLALTDFLYFINVWIYRENKFYINISTKVLEPSKTCLA